MKRKSSQTRRAAVRRETVRISEQTVRWSGSEVELKRSFVVRRPLTKLNTNLLPDIDTDPERPRRYLAVKQQLDLTTIDQAFEYADRFSGSTIELRRKLEQITDGFPKRLMGFLGKAAVFNSPSPHNEDELEVGYTFSTGLSKTLRNESMAILSRMGLTSFTLSAAHLGVFPTTSHSTAEAVRDVLNKPGSPVHIMLGPPQLVPIIQERQ